MPTPEFILALRKHVGHDLLWVPGITAVIFDDDGRVLLNRRADTGEWALIAGIPDPGEQPAQAAVREAFEETGVHIEVDRIAAVVAEDPLTYPNGDVVQFLDITMRCRAVGGRARVNDDESLAVEWFPRDALPPMAHRMRERLDLAEKDGPTWFVPPTADG
jgi:8-oxo-dGTP pyrophosphatase MutT (NUDIX family)